MEQDKKRGALTPEKNENNKGKLVLLTDVLDIINHFTLLQQQKESLINIIENIDQTELVNLEVNNNTVISAIFFALDINPYNLFSTERRDIKSSLRTHHITEFNLDRLHRDD